MTYYQLCNINYPIKAENLKLNFIKSNIDSKIYSQSLASYLYKTKEEINQFVKEWDTVKKLTNPYEFIHTAISIKANSISKIKPISRAFFKLIEICNVLDVFKNFSSKPIKSFHLAEGPGGFIEATVYLRHNKYDRYFGMTLIDDTNYDVPGWKKGESFLQENNNVTIEYGYDGKGNLYNHHNFKFCREKYGNSMDFITGDGGFDFSVDYNRQENMVLRLILTQVAYAISMQAKGGTFILKMFDLFSQSSVDILYILSSFYKSTYVIKPNTSREANSEKYIVCVGFKYDDTSEISNKFLSILHVLNNLKINDMQIHRILNIKINYKYIKMIEEINAIIGSQQIENILSTLRIIQNKERKGEKIQSIKNKNIQKCIQWCIKHHIPYNKYGTNTNIFMSSKD